jgi:hypothetical protein
MVSENDHFLMKFQELKIEDQDISNIYMIFNKEDLIGMIQDFNRIISISNAAVIKLNKFAMQYIKNVAQLANELLEYKRSKTFNFEVARYILTSQSFFYNKDSNLNKMIFEKYII